MPLENTLLVSMNYETSKGGVSRVAHLMGEAVIPNRVFSLYGNENLSSKNIRYFAKKKLPFLWAFVAYILFHRPKLIICDHIGPASLLAMIPVFLLKKVVVFLHDEEAWKPVSARHKLGLNKATHILCNSDYTYQKFIAHNPIFASKTQVCLLAGVPKSFENTIIQISNNAYSSWLEGTPFLIFVSRLWQEHRYKGYMELIDGWKLAKEKNPAFALRLAIVGNGDDAKNVTDKIQNTGLNNCISLFTEISDIDLSIFYSKSKGLIFPSIREGFGFVFLEAMYYGKCCIAVIDQPAAEIIAQNSSGILMKDNSPETICEILLDMDANPAKYEEMGKRGKIIYNEKFTNADFKKRFLNCIA